MRRLPVLGVVVVLAVQPAAGCASVSEAGSRRSDLQEFRELVLGRDHSYATQARAEAETRLARLESDAARISAAAFELELARLVALADNGHTMAFASPRSRRYNHVGLRLVPLGQDFYVLRARDENADLLGARLAGIDRQPLEALREAARTLSGGLPAWRDRFAPYLLESPEQMEALGLVPQREGAVYRFTTIDGTTVERRLEAGPPGGARERGDSSRWLHPELQESEKGSWRTLISPGQAPWSLLDPDEPFRWRDAPEIEGMVIELRQSTDHGGRSIRSFFEEMTRRLRESRPANLVLDMRLNGGGDLTRTRDFMQSLPGLVPGRIFALTSPWTFSAAISSLGYLKQTAPGRVTIVGEPVGDRLQFWAEGRPLELSYSHAMIQIATQRHDYLTGCRTFADCHEEVRVHPISVTTLDPDLPAPWTIDAYRSGRDPAMEAVAAALRTPIP